MGKKMFQVISQVADDSPVSETTWQVELRENGFLCHSLWLKKRTSCVDIGNLWCEDNDERQAAIWRLDSDSIKWRFEGTIGQQ